MSRDYQLYLQDILEAAGNIRWYTKGYSLKWLTRDSKTLDAVVRKLEVLGEAASSVVDLEAVRASDPKAPVGSFRARFDSAGDARM